MLSQVSLTHRSAHKWPFRIPDGLPILAPGLPGSVRMSSRDILRSQSIERCLRTLEMDDFQIELLAPLRMDLMATVDEITELYRIQARWAKVKPVNEGEALRKDIRERLLLVQDLALAALHGLPGIREDVRVPHKNANRKIIVEATERIVRNVRPHLATLHAKGLRRDVIPDLERDARKLAQLRPPVDTPMARRSRATASLPDAIRRGRKIVAALDRLIRREFHGQPALASWEMSARIPGKPGRPKKSRRRRPPPSEPA